MPLLPFPNKHLSRQVRSLKHSATISPNPQANLSGWFHKQKALWVVRRWLELRGSILIYRHNRHSEAQWTVDLRECMISAGCRAKELIIKRPTEQHPISLLAPSLDEFKLWFTELKRVADNVHSFYHLAASISHVQSGSIFLARDRTTDERVSVFAHQKKLLTESSRRAIQQRDGRVIKATQNHSSILHVIDVFETMNVAYVVTELIFGNSLHDTINNSDSIYHAPFATIKQSADWTSQAHIQTSSSSNKKIKHSVKPKSLLLTNLKHHHHQYEHQDQQLSDTSASMKKKIITFTENHIRRFARNLLSALAHLHARGIIHGMLDNNHIIFTRRLPCDAFDIKLIVFGFACLNDFDRLPIDNVARAPEVICFQQRTSKADVFGMGVLLFRLLTGEAPFHWVGGDDEFLGAVSHGLYGKAWDNLPSGIKGLLKAMLQEKKEDRPSARLCLRHSWFDDDENESEKENEDVYKNNNSQQQYGGDELSEIQINDDHSQGGARRSARCWTENVSEINGLRNETYPQPMMMEFEMSSVSGEGLSSINDNSDEDNDGENHSGSNLMEAQYEME